MLRTVRIERTLNLLFDTMRVGETELEMVERHVRQGEKQVERQRENIPDLEVRGQQTRVAEHTVYL